jgi:hypothetical protein
MIISKTDTIAGVDARTMRDALRRPGGYITAEDIAPRLQTSLKKTKEIIAALEQDGYLDKVRESTWRTSVKGQALVMASLRGTPRAAAERQLSELIERAEQINADDRYAYSVERLVLFGSLLDPDRQEVGDVDVWYTVVGKWKSPDEARQMHQNSVHRAEAAGRSFRGFSDRLSWPQQEVMLKLQNRSKVISLHPDWEMEVVDWPRRVVFEAKDVEMDGFGL